jgi:hypothetical protein
MIVYGTPMKPWNVPVFVNSRRAGCGSQAAQGGWRWRWSPESGLRCQRDACTCIYVNIGNHVSWLPVWHIHVKSGNSQTQALPCVPFVAYDAPDETHMSLLQGMRSIDHSCS